MINKKLSIFAVFVVLATISVMDSTLADFSLSSTSKTISFEDFEETKTEDLFEINADTIGDLTNIQITSEDFVNSYNDKLADVSFNYLNSISSNDSAMVTATIISNDDLEDELTRTITITGIQNGTQISKTFSLTIDVQSPYLKIDLDDKGDLEELDPGDDFTLALDVDNIVGEDIEDIDIDVDIIDIEGGEKDLDDSFSKFDLDEGDDDTVKVDFTVPLNTVEDDFDIVLSIKGDLKDSDETFSYRKVFKGAVEVIKDEDEEIQFDNVEIQPSTLSCGASLIVDATAINTGEDDLDENDIYVRLIIESRTGSQRTLVDERYNDFNNELEGDGANDDKDREEDIRFSVAMPNDLTDESYTLRLVMYFENSVVGEHVEYVSATPCTNVPSDEEEEDDGTTPPPTTDDGDGTVFLPTGFTVFGLESGTWTTIFWILGDVLLVIIAIYFIVLLFRRRR